MKLNGQWTTEYGVQITHAGTDDTAVIVETTSPDDARAALIFHRGCGYAAILVTRQTFHSAWQPLAGKDTP